MDALVDKILHTINKVSGQYVVLVHLIEKEGIGPG